MHLAAQLAEMCREWTNAMESLPVMLSAHVAVGKHIEMGLCVAETKETAVHLEGRTCSPTPSRGDIGASDGKGSPPLDSTHSQGTPASPNAAADSSSKASENEAESGSHGSKADVAQASGSQSSHQKQEGGCPALASCSDEASGGHGSGTMCIQSSCRRLCQSDRRG